MHFYRKICSLFYWKKLRKTQPAFHLRVLMIAGTALMILLIAYFSDPITQRRTPVSDHRFSATTYDLPFNAIENNISYRVTTKFLTTFSLPPEEASPPIYIENYSFLL